ncbi:carbohydrate ABC transporter permease [Fundicoccus culcitae]|uniref:Carbohydrate ABC transporter permease n=1 Tax=Fundicoccus culcitae TaxID=2969821 RepID=A0ABY5P3A6_9LACT|nr:carbohydrate ABC transporter permease [Fundicoccus culcitae]UUX33186.1 carbohydrate ABC transporter permease [Fundicoccus culcitae]
MLRQTFMRIPNELIEAAKLDRASELTIVRKIMMPIARPTIVTLSLLTFIGSWNEYFWPLTMTTNDTVRTLPVGVASLINAETGTNYHILMAGNVLLILPIVIIYLFAHRQIIQAFTYTGEK